MMTQFGIVIDKESWTVLQNEPLYSARFIDREGAEELALVVRVEELDWFLDAHPPLSCDMAVWQDSRGTWVARITYQLHPTFGGSKGGVFYLNPRQAADAQILRKLPQQERLSVVFLSEDCSTHYTVSVVQPPQELIRWQQQFAMMQQRLTGQRLDGEEDPDFALALKELHALPSPQ